MSKQYLTTHTSENAHETDIFCLATTPTSVLSASGSSSIRVHSTASSNFPLAQTLDKAHKIGCHHIAASATGRRAVSAGFEGDVIVWECPSDNEGKPNGDWEAIGKVTDGNKAGEVWAIALSEDGQHLVSTTQDGRVNVWEFSAIDSPFSHKKIRSYETRGTFGTATAISPNSGLTASGHSNGAIYVFNNESGRLLHPLPSMMKPVRALKFSPQSPGLRPDSHPLLAAAGDSRTVAVYDAVSGDHLSILKGHDSWILSLDWNPGSFNYGTGGGGGGGGSGSYAGEYLLTGSFDGKVKVWNVDTRQCVATISDALGGTGGVDGEVDRRAGDNGAVWAVSWIKRVTSAVERVGGEGFIVAGTGGRMSFYREAASG